VTVIVSAAPTVSAASTVTTPEPLTARFSRLTGANPLNENVTV
jgi:hypothetical protein